jgi:uncharacterized protein YndB with AHSA1/START domain
MSDGERTRDVRLEIHIDASPETVFGLLTDPAHMKIWFAELVEADARPGGLFRISGPAGVSIEGNLPRDHSEPKSRIHLGRRGRAQAGAVDGGVPA